jgi:mono/diheme cytochrome c family protein
MKALKSRASNRRLALVALAALTGLFAWVANSWAQPPVPHGVMEGDDCLSCHEARVAAAPRLARDHIGRLNEDCAFCHEHSGALAGDIPHPLVGRDDCLSCHSTGIGTILDRSHLERTNEQCELCHLPSPASLEPIPIPTPLPTPEPAAHPATGGAESCVACHQLIFADEEHALFTGQPKSDAQAGAELFAQLCANCHGEDGSTPVGEQDNVINSQEYWGSHDDAAILVDIGAGAHGEMTAFAETYGGPFSWEEILGLMAFVRSWGPMAPPSIAPATQGLTYSDTIGPLLAEKCSVCHGGLAGLTVTDYASLLSGTVIAPGDPEGSRIVEVQRGEHPVQLSAEELELLIEWIANGALE